MGQEGLWHYRGTDGVTTQEVWWRGVEDQGSRCPLTQTLTRVQVLQDRAQHKIKLEGQRKGFLPAMSEYLPNDCSSPSCCGYVCVVLDQPYSHWLFLSLSVPRLLQHRNVECFARSWAEGAADITKRVDRRCSLVSPSPFSYNIFTSYLDFQYRSFSVLVFYHYVLSLCSCPDISFNLFSFRDLEWYFLL